MATEHVVYMVVALTASVKRAEDIGSTGASTLPQTDPESPHTPLTNEFAAHLFILIFFPLRRVFRHLFVADGR